MSNLHHDPDWPRASAWLAGDSLPDGKSTLTVLGVPLKKGSITPGRCDLAPAAIRKALERYSTAHLVAGQDLRHLKAQDAGDLDVAESTPAEAFEGIRDAVAKHTGEADAMVLLGGDNSITRAGVHGLGAPLERCGLITLDAHFDLRTLEGGLTNGNPVRALLDDGLPGDQIVQIGLQSFANSSAYAEVAREAGIEVLTMDDVTEYGLVKVIQNALAGLGGRVDRLYVNFDVDVLDRASAPACPGSRPGGMTPFQLRRAARLCGAHHRVHAIDIVEIDPTCDVADVTVLAAAAVLLEFATGVLERHKL